MSLAERPVELDTTDKSAAYNAVLQAMRAGDKTAAFEAFKVWSDMPTPGHDENPHLATLMGLVEGADYWGRNPDVRRARKAAAVKSAQEAVDCLAWEWKHYLHLGQHYIRRPSIVADDEVGARVTDTGYWRGQLGVRLLMHDDEPVEMVGETTPEGDEVLVMRLKEGAVSVFRVVPKPQPGIRYFLVPANEVEPLIKASAAGGEGTYSGMVAQLRDLRLAVMRSLEWTMPEPHVQPSEP